MLFRSQVKAHDVHKCPFCNFFQLNSEIHYKETTTLFRIDYKVILNLVSYLFHPGSLLADGLIVQVGS